jgi:RimJ/RimL family protein N-acetyltransferase
MSVLLETERLLLRPPRAADISHFVPLLGEFEVAKNLSRVPHPYTEDDACAFIVVTAHAWRNGTEFNFAILRKESPACIGNLRRAPSAQLGVRLLAGQALLGPGLRHRSSRLA